MSQVLGQFQRLCRARKQCLVLGDVQRKRMSDRNEKDPNGSILDVILWIAIIGGIALMLIVKFTIGFGL